MASTAAELGGSIGITLVCAVERLSPIVWDILRGQENRRGEPSGQGFYNNLNHWDKGSTLSQSPCLHWSLLLQVLESISLRPSRIFIKSSLVARVQYLLKTVNSVYFAFECPVQLRLEALT